MPVEARMGFMVAAHTFTYSRSPHIAVNTGPGPALWGGQRHLFGPHGRLVALLSAAFSPGIDHRLTINPQLYPPGYSGPITENQDSRQNMLLRIMEFELRKHGSLLIMY